MRFRIRTLLIATAIVAVVAFGVSMVNRIDNTIRNAYALWWVGDMVVEHLDANNDEWPQGWDELLDDYDTCAAKAGAAPWKFAELKRRVRIDWKADAKQLVTQQANGEPEFKAIWLADGTTGNWADAEPNQIVLDYLPVARSRAVTNNRGTKKIIGASCVASGLPSIHFSSSQPRSEKL